MAETVRDQFRGELIVDDVVIASASGDSREYVMEFLNREKKKLPAGADWQINFTATLARFARPTPPGGGR